MAPAWQSKVNPECFTQPDTVYCLSIRDAILGMYTYYALLNHVVNCHKQVRRLNVQNEENGTGIITEEGVAW